MSEEDILWFPTQLSWMALENKMVEAAGIEPASENGPRQITTCLAFIWF